MLQPVLPLPVPLNVVPVPSLQDVFTQLLLDVAKAPSLVDVNIAAGLALEVLKNLPG